MAPSLRSFFRAAIHRLIDSSLLLREYDMSIELWCALAGELADQMIIEFGYVSPALRANLAGHGRAEG